MVVGGYNSDERYMNHVEVASLDPVASPVPDCLKTRNPFDHELTSASIGLTTGEASIFYSLALLGSEES